MAVSRDYKHARRSDGEGFDLNQYRQLGLGLAIGLAVALGVWIYHLRSLPTTQLDAVPQAAASAAEEEAPVPEEPAEQDPATSYDFYDMLPKFEVEVPAKGRAAAPAPAARPVEQPGAYVIQAGSYRNLPDAERLRSQLAKLGIEAAIQHADSWHRVRIGPLRDLEKLNAIRRELRAADIDAFVVRVPD